MGYLLKYLRKGEFSNLAKDIEERINSVTIFMNFLEYQNSIISRDWLLSNNDEMMLHGSSKMSVVHFFFKQYFIL